MRAGLVRSFCWGSVSRLFFFPTIKNSKDVPCFMAVFVDSYAGGVSFLQEWLQLWGLVRIIIIIFICFFFLGICLVWVCVGVRGCARGGACARGRSPGRTAVYSCINWSWSLVQSLES